MKLFFLSLMWWRALCGQRQTLSIWASYLADIGCMLAAQYRTQHPQLHSPT